MRTTFPRYTLLAIAAIAAACSDQPSTAPITAPPLFNAKTFASLSGVWKDSVIGTTDSGALYGLYMPANWNGDVVYYAHGFIAPAAPIVLPPGDDAVPIRDALGPLGFAVAYSTFSQNGYDFKDGMQRTHQLRKLFANKFGKPRRSFLLGESLGGQIVQAIAEEDGKQYDGVLALCGVLGGTKLEVDYIGQIRTVFDFFYPGVLPGTTILMPPITDLNAQIIIPAYTAIQTNPNGFGAIAQIDQTLLAGRNATEMVTTLLNVLGYQALAANDLMGRTHGHSLFDNRRTTYTSAALPPSLMTALNGAVTRYTGSEFAEEWLEENYQPSGKLRIPMLTLHKRFDRLVPFRHEAAYKQIVDRAGNTANLRQRTVEDYGHCDFGTDVAIANFQDLVKWVATGTPPAP